jgi:hypothetical protein
MLRRFVLFVCVLAAVPLALKADEGFWPINRLPKAAIKAAYGVDVDESWLQRVQHASVRFPGGSGAFVSARGLVLTNHHVAMEVLQALSTLTQDYVKSGFLARTHAEELRVPDLELAVLDRIEDVTSRVDAAVTPAMSASEQLAARRAAIASIESAAEEKTGLHSEMVTLYHGAQYHLYLYKTFTDIRLVFAPEFGAAFFGGDPDNFNYPRYALDMTVFRVYERGQPLVTTHYLPWSRSGAQVGAPVFTSGHPGATQRLNTVAHLEVLREHSIPLALELYGRLRDALDGYRQRGAEQERQAGDLFLGLENSLKSWRGQLAGLRDPWLLETKRRAEIALREAVTTNASHRTRFGDAWDNVAAARRALVSYNLERLMFEGGLAFFSDSFNYARTLVRWADESGKPNGERLPEYIDARRSQIERHLRSETPVYSALEKVRLAAALTLMREKLGAGHPLVGRILGGHSPESRAAALVDNTRLGNAAFRQELLAGGAAAVKASSDPMIELARLVDPRARELRRKYDNEVLAVERDAYAKIAQAVFATEGERAYPDATRTLRLSYGTVQGYEEDGQPVAPFTELGGLYARADQNGHQPPYALPPGWMNAKSRLDLTTPLNFVTTNDIVGGNSGSPVINARGELVGLIFDGNRHSLPGYFVYDGRANRAIAVDARGMLEALRKVYGAAALVDEILAQ